MKLVRGAWKLLVGIKDALVLIAMLLFFGLVFAALNARPGTKAIKDGALVLDLNGSIVEQPAEPAAFAALSGQNTPKQFRLRDVVRAIDTARTDGRVKALVLDLDGFTGAYPAALGEIGDAIARVRAAKKPVLAYATAYTDGSYRLAANASEVWVNPLGGTLFMGPGGNQLYYKGLIDKLGITTHVYRVGRYKSFVEPYTRTDQSDDARAASQALYGTLFDQWREAVAKARPKAQIAQFLARPDALVLAANGDIATANLRAGIVDKLGDRTAFGKRVAAIAGADTSKPAGSFNTITYDSWVKANPLPTGGDAIGVLTVAGDIVDGEGGPGTAAGKTIEKAMLDGLAKKNLKALVVRVDSPGGSVLASERIRLAILEAKKKGLPVVVSMGGLAASGGYWVSTPADVIFAEPGTITGSIGIFGIIPTFETALAKIGVTTDGVKTTPLSGQPDITAGTTPMFDTLIQAGIENGYRQFIARVAASRKLSPARVDAIGQGRVWDGGTARQIGLVDRFGTLKDAIAEAARRAKLDPAKIHAEYLEKPPGVLAQLAAGFDTGDDDTTTGSDAFGRIALDRRQMVARAVGDMKRLATSGSIQARCLECGGIGPSAGDGGDARLLDLLLARIGL
ncbi:MULTISPECIES: signal peptide peptidase SppA [Sphingomonas]|uniref:signal peptide peptidase SppA n=1 Tax=Sphingomonas TaxID=13687 RepID=UPI0006FEC6EB|nr:MULTISPECIES: signal peptide peptidase SppA [Sphingomonas]KQM91328.1 signal peptide peptidase SppA [Sphingomonas sp. Leaf226]MDY0966532.1 signal peptide peptidase SppA [Sphingomonas sp. CFBP9021]USR02221.1 signal peptide peptidase SppA [Sphingomonas aerolata]